MLTSEQSTAILSLLMESRRTLSSGPSPSTESPTEYAAKVELREEIEALSAIVLTDDFERAFKERCLLRAIAHSNTSLSFFSSPHTACNSLYWNIALQLIPAPNSMGKMLDVLVPNVRQCLRPSLDAHKIQREWKYSVNLIEEPIVTVFTEPPSLETLTEFVVLRNGLLFHVTDIRHYNFDLHALFYEQLSRRYADTIGSLYQHNMSLRKLQDQLLAIRQTQSPMEAIRQLISALQKHANTADTAFTEFLVYLGSLSPENKRILLSLAPRNCQSNTIGNIVERLLSSEGMCTVMASIYLNAIISAPENHALLTSQLSVSAPLSQESIIEIKKAYGRRNQLSTARDNKANPDIHEHFLLSKIKHVNEIDHTILLYFLHGAFYDRLLRQSRKYDDDLQRRPYNFLIATIKGISSDQAIQKLSLANDEGNTALHMMASRRHRYHLGVWVAIMAKLPEHERLAAIQKKNNAGESVLYLLLRNSPENDYYHYQMLDDFLEVIISSLPENKRFAALTERIDRYTSVVCYTNQRNNASRMYYQEAIKHYSYWFWIHLATDCSALFGATGLLLGAAILDTVIISLGAGLLLGATALACYSFFSSKPRGEPASAGNRLIIDPSPVIAHFH